MLARSSATSTEEHDLVGCPKGVCDVLAFGARGDGKTVDTSAVRAAADALRTLHHGGVLLFPARGSKARAVYLTGPFNLTSNCVLRVEAGATILGNTADRNETWPLVDAGVVWPQFGHGDACVPGNRDCRLLRQAFVFAWGVHNVSIEGRGTIDGQGAPYWACASEWARFPCSGHARPHLLMISDASDIRMEGVTVKNSPEWTLHFASVDRLHVDGVTVINPPDAPNADGIDLDCVRGAVVENSRFDVGDDALCVKSGVDWFGRQYGRESANITFRNNHIGHGHGITVGSETSGGVTNVTFESMDLQGTECGPRIKSQRGRGGTVDGITFRNITASSLRTMVCVTLNYHTGLQPTNASATPHLQNVLFEDLVFLDSQDAGGFDGLPESPILNITLRNVRFPSNASFGKCDYVSGGVCEGNTSKCPPCFKDRTHRGRMILV